MTDSTQELDETEKQLWQSYQLTATQAKDVAEFIAAYKDKAVEQMLDRLEQQKEDLFWWTGGEYDRTTAVDMRAIAAERAKLKEVK